MPCRNCSFQLTGPSGGLRPASRLEEDVEEAHDAPRQALDYAESVADRFGLDYVPADVVEPGDVLVNISGNVRSGPRFSTVV